MIIILIRRIVSFKKAFHYLNRDHLILVPWVDYALIVLTALKRKLLLETVLLLLHKVLDEFFSTLRLWIIEIGFLALSLLANVWKMGPMSLCLTKVKAVITLILLILFLRLVSDALLFLRARWNSHIKRANLLLLLVFIFLAIFIWNVIRVRVLA